jgi:hypothetical protein
MSATKVQKDPLRERLLEELRAERVGAGTLVGEGAVPLDDQAALPVDAETTVDKHRAASRIDR